MLENPPDLSPDLEWMLQSGQASDTVLIDELLRVHSAEIYRMVYGLTGNPQRAEAIVARALADAVLDAHRYPVGLGVQTWLFSLVQNRSGPREDPSNSRLSFQWTQVSAFDNDQPIMTDIFAGRYFLGSIDFGDPDRLICTRSPDGRRIAYSEWLETSPFGAAPLRWLDLADLSRIFQLQPVVEAWILSFSPDSQRLAFLGGEGVNDTGLYVLDLASGKPERILDLDGGDELEWSPDGRYLSLIGAENPDSEWNLLVVNAGNGEIVYRGPVEWGQAGHVIVPEDSPVYAWGPGVFLPRPSAVEACARPPIG